MKQKISGDEDLITLNIVIPFSIAIGITMIIIVDITIFEYYYLRCFVNDSWWRSWMVFCGFAILIYQCTYRFACLKNVSTDESFFYVSGLRGKEIKIPFSDVVRVRQTYLMRAFRIEKVVIILASPSEFGKKIFFMPDDRKHIFLEPHPIVEELNELLSSHKQKKKE